MSPFRALNSKYENEQKTLKISNLKQSTGFLIQNKSHNGKFGGGKDTSREYINTNFGASFDRRGNGSPEKPFGEIYSPSKAKSPIKKRIESPRKINKNSPNGSNFKYI